eukprot:g2343.t1
MRVKMRNAARQASRSHATELEVRMREARATTTAAKDISKEEASVALETLEDIAEEYRAPYGGAILMAAETLRRAVFSSDAISNGGNLPYFTLCDRLIEDARQLVREADKLRLENQRLHEAVAIQNEDNLAMRVQLRDDKRRSMRLQMELSKWQTEQRGDVEKLRKERDAAMASFGEISRERKIVDMKVAKARAVIEDLTAYRDRVESMKLRFQKVTRKRGKTQARTAGAVPSSSSRKQLETLALQLHAIYSEKLEKFDGIRNDGSYPPVQLQSARERFRNDASALRQERRNLHRALGTFPRESVLEQLQPLRTHEKRMWRAYRLFAERCFQGQRRQVLPPEWPHPLAKGVTEIEDVIMVILQSANAVSMDGGIAGPASANICAVVNCPPQGVAKDETLESLCAEQRFIPLGDFVSLYWLSQYLDVSIALAAHYAFLRNIEEWSTSSSILELFQASLCDEVPSSAWKCTLEMSRLLREEVCRDNLSSYFEKKMFRSVLQQVYCRDNEDDQCSTTDLLKASASLSQFVLKLSTVGDEDDSEKIFLRWYTNEILAGTELHYLSSMRAIELRDLEQTGDIRLSRFQSICIDTLYPLSLSRHEITLHFRIAAYEAAMDVFGNVVGKRHDDALKNLLGLPVAKERLGALLTSMHWRGTKALEIKSALK